jgi:hypothetical protein
MSSRRVASRSTSSPRNDLGRAGAFRRGNWTRRYATLTKIKDCNGVISADEKNRASASQDIVIPGTEEAYKESSRLLIGRAATAREDFDKHLMELERQMKKYLDFKNIDGWTVRVPR